ncbi:MAG: hypothetical protein U1A27_12685 [Phycisphaerae bacterium]
MFDAAPPATPAVLFAPLRHFWQPRRAAATLLAATRRQQALFIALYLLLIGAAIVGVVTAETIDQARRAHRTIILTGTSQPAPGASAAAIRRMLQAAPPRPPVPGVLEVWRGWLAPDTIGWILLWTTLGLLQAALVAAVVALLFWPRITDGQKPLADFGRTLLALVTGLGPLALLAVWLGGGLVFLSVLLADPTLPATRHEQFIICSLGVGALALLRWLSAAVIAARHDQPPALALLCEQCGYNLAHIGADGRCTECGAAVAPSIEPGASRTPGPWATAAPKGGWLVTTFSVLKRPQAVYRAARLREDDAAAAGFEGRTHTLILVMALAWMQLVFDLSSVPAGPVESILIPLVIAVAAATMGFVLHRAVTAAVLIAWLCARSLHDVRVVRTVFACESAWLWLHCAWNGALITSFIACDNWITRALSPLIFGRALRFSALEGGVTLGGNLVLILLWLLRFRRISRAIRWANY